MTIGAQFATLAYVETMRRNLMLAISGAGVTALPPASESEEGIDTFLGLTDTPDDYTSMAGRIPVVNAAEDALEFNPYVLIDPSSPIITVRNLSDGDVDLVHKWASGETPVVKFSDGMDLTDGNYIWCNTDGLVDTTIGGTGWGTSLIICDYTNNRVKQHLASTLAYSSQVASAGAQRVCTDGTNYYVSDATNHQIRKYLIATNALLWTVGTQGSGDDQFDAPQGIDTDGTYLYIADKTNCRIKKHLCSTGAYVAKLGSYGTTLGKFITPTGICTDGTWLYITEGNPGATPLLKKHLCSDLSGVDQISADGHLDDTNCLDICTDGASLYLVNANNGTLNSIFRYTLALVYVSEYGANGTGDTQFATPYGICTDKTYLYVTDTGNARIKKHLVADYSYVAQAGTDGIGDDNLRSPRGICVGYLGEPRTGRLLRLRQDGSHFEVWPKLDLYNHLVFREDSALATDYVAIKAPSAITTSYTLTLPPADAAGALTSDGAGALSFTAVCPLGAKYIVQEADATLTAEQSLGALATGILKNTTTAGVGVLSIAVGTDLPAHVLNSAVHSVSGLTSGHFLKATGAATFGFAAHGLTASDVAAEPALGNPGVDDYVLSSKIDGTRAWIAAGGALALDDLTDVDAASPSDDDIIRFDTVSGLWKHEALPAAANHDLMSATHADTTAAAVVRGDIITAQGASPTWKALAKGTEGHVLTMGADEPGWAVSASGAPTDAKYIVGLANATLSAEKVKPQLYNNYDIDDTPAAPNALDDEFDDSSLNVKWTKVNDPAGANAISETAYPGYVWVGLPEQTGTDNYDSAVRLYQAAPAGNAAATYIAKVCLGISGLESSTDAGEFAAASIYLGNSTDDEFVASAVMYNDGPGDQFSSMCVSQANGASGTWGNTTFNNYQIVPAAGTFYLKLEKTTTAAYTSANTYNMYYSFNGIVWEHIGQQVKTFTHDVNEVGIMFRLPKAQGGSPVAYGLCDFFRRTV